MVHNPLVRNYFMSDKHNSQLCTIKDCMSCEMDRLFTKVGNLILFWRLFCTNPWLDILPGPWPIWTHDGPPFIVAQFDRVSQLWTTRCPRVLHFDPQSDSCNVARAWGHTLHMPRALDVCRAVSKRRTVWTVRERYVDVGDDA
jgi:hypothetical protein